MWQKWQKPDRQIGVNNRQKGKAPRSRGSEGGNNPKWKGKFRKWSEDTGGEWVESGVRWNVWQENSSEIKQCWYKMAVRPAVIYSVAWRQQRCPNNRKLHNAGWSYIIHKGMNTPLKTLYCSSFNIVVYSAHIYVRICRYVCIYLCICVCVCLYR